MHFKHLSGICLQILGQVSAIIMQLGESIVIDVLSLQLASMAFGRTKFMCLQCKVGWLSWGINLVDVASVARGRVSFTCFSAMASSECGSGY